MTRFLCLFSFALALLAVAAGCTDRTGNPALTTDQPVLRRGNGGDPGTLDPARAFDIHAFNVLDDLYEGLVTVSGDGALAPGAAARWSHDDALMRFEFEIRADARWSTGDPVTAADFVRGLRRLADPATNAPYAPLLAAIRGFADVQAGTAPVSTLAVRATDNQTLVIELDRPGHTILDVLAMPIAAPLHESLADGKGFDDPSRFVGNGAYRLAYHRPNDRTRLVANPHYRDVSRLAYCTVEFLPIVDPATEVTLYRAGELDMTHSLPPQQVEALKARLPEAVRIAPQLGVYFLALDITEPALANRDLRVALSMAIDRRQLVTLLGRGEQPAWGLLPPGLIDSDTYDWATLDDDARKARARDLLRSAVGNGPAPGIRLVFDAGDVHERIALSVADMWRNTLGIETEMDKREWAYFLDTRNRREEWDVMRYSWFADFGDAESFLGLFRSGSEHNLPGFADPRYDAMLDAAASATDPATRKAHLTAAAQHVDAAYAYAPLYHYVSKRLVRPSVLNYRDNLLDRHPSALLGPVGTTGGCLPR